MANHVVGNAESGSIIFLHALGSNNQITRDSIALIVSVLRAKGFQFVTILNLLKEHAY